MEPKDKESIIEIRIKKAKETIEDARIALENARLRNALNRIYYAIFYIVSALAAKDDFSTSKHRQLMGWFIKNYVSNGRIDAEFSNIYKKAFENRQESDYEDFVEFETEEVESHFADMKVFVEEIEKMITKE